MINEAQARKLSWKSLQDELADEHGLAIVVVEGENSVVVSESNNNSICRHLYASAEFAPRCAEYCGKAFQQATEAGKTIQVKCHAELNYLAVPIETKEKKLVAIVGRTFLKSDEYRNATERAISGDWQKFSPEEFFSNVLIANSIYDLEPLARKIEKLRDGEKQALIEFEKNAVKLPEEIYDQAETRESKEQIEPEVSSGKTSDNQSESLAKKTFNEPKLEEISDEQFVYEISEYTKWRSVFGSLLDLDYHKACAEVLKFLEKRFRQSSLAWFERRGEEFEIIMATGVLQNGEMQIGISANDKRILDAIQNETSLVLKERQKDKNVKAQVVELFPVAVGNQVRGALIVGDEISNESEKRKISRFAKSVAAELEILRLRQEIERQEHLQSAIRKFNQSLREIDGEDIWQKLTQTSAEILRAERGSLLAFDEISGIFTAKGVVGRNADFIKREKVNLGDRIAKTVIMQSEPVLVKDVQKSGISPAPQMRNYKTKSFISYPIIINNRKIGVLNLTDKADGTAYNELDLQILNTFAPQLAVALDRTSLKQRAGKFEMLSITDALTGLPNRRYLEERLAEEIKRWQRDGSPLSFMMIDVDEFKSYNDKFSHPEGDKALKIVGHALKATLRGADVPARYGGEEFSILLPQTALSEAVTIAERVRERVERTVFPHRKVTISIGIAACTQSISTVEKLIQSADQALYEAKSAGRNNVQIFKS